MAATLNPSKTALLLLDLQVGILGRLPEAAQNSVLDAAETLVKAARAQGVKIHYVHAALTADDLKEVPSHNKMFSAIRDNEGMAAAFHPDASTTKIHDRIAPAGAEKLHRKVRFGTFMRAPSLGLLGDLKGIETIIIGGVVTSGAVLSAVRQLADLDFELYVVKDVCADHSPETHDFLCEKIFPAQTTVTTSAEVIGLIGGK